MKVLWIKWNNESVPYNKASHAREVCKFLYWHNNGDEILLANRGGIGSATHAALRKEAGSFAPEQKPDGAGDAKLGRIISWTSTGYDIETPVLLRSKIAEVLGLVDAVPANRC